MKKLFYFIAVFTAVCALNAAEKQKTFGDWTLHYGTDDAGQYFENPQKWCLEHDLEIGYKILSEDSDEFIKLSDEAIRKECGSNEYYYNILLIVRTIALYGLKKAEIKIKKNGEEGTGYILRDKDGNLYCAREGE